MCWQILMGQISLKTTKVLSGQTYINEFMYVIHEVLLDGSVGRL